MVGLSNVTVEQLETAREYIDVATVQNRYNIANRETEPVLDACEDYGIGFIPWFPLAAGELDEISGVVDDVVASYDVTRHQVAIAWLLEYSDVTLPIPGASNIKHLEENVAATSISLSEEDLTRLTEVGERAE